MDIVKIAIQQLRELKKNKDTEAAHVEADEILLDVIRSEVGSKELVRAYNAIKKWYA